MSAEQDTLEHNVSQVARFLEYAPSYIGPGAPSGEPMGKKYKGTSRVPAAEAAHDFWEANRDAAKILNPRIRELHKDADSPHEALRGVSWRGVYFSHLLTILYADPAVLPRWENRETQEDRDHIGAFWKMCRLIAQSIKAEYGPDRQINVELPRKSVRVKNKREAADIDRTAKAEDSYRAIVASLEALEFEGYTKSAADVTLSERLDCSIPRIRKAREFVKRERDSKENNNRSY